MKKFFNEFLIGTSLAFLSVGGIIALGIITMLAIPAFAIDALRMRIFKIEQEPSSEKFKDYIRDIREDLF